MVWSNRFSIGPQTGGLHMPDLCEGSTRDGDGVSFWGVDTWVSTWLKIVDGFIKIQIRMLGLNMFRPSIYNYSLWRFIGFTLTKNVGEPWDLSILRLESSQPPWQGLC